MNIQQVAQRSAQEQSAWPSSPPPAICGWQSPPCDAPAVKLVQWRMPGETATHRAVFCALHFRYASHLAIVEEEQP